MGVYFECGKILKLLWQIFYVIGKTYYAIDGQNLINNLSIWTRWSQAT